MHESDLELRIKRLEDIENIKKLKAIYCAYADDNYDADGIAGLFTEDGVWDGGIRGKYEGRESIRSFFMKGKDRVTFAVHNVINPVIEIEDSAATAQWNLFQPCTVEGKACWVSGVYNDYCVKIDAQWVFKRMEVRFNFWTSFEKGWVEEPFIVSGQ